MAGQGLKFIQGVVKMVTESGAFERVLDKVSINNINNLLLTFTQILKIDDNLHLERNC